MEQEEIYREAHERGPNWSYPEYEGPGFTEPPLNWCGEHHEGWTFTQWAEEREFAAERIEEIDIEFPQDQAELDYARRRDEAMAEHDFARDWDDYSAWRIEHPLPERPEPEPPGLLRIVPMEKRRDGVWESPREREIRGEPNPYDPMHFPNYSYWAPGREAAE
jgi:hypothetical protein